MSDSLRIDAVLRAVAQHGNVARALREIEFASGTFYDAIGADEDLAGRYTRAKQLGLHAVADETFDIADRCLADKDAVAKARLQIETRKWHLAKLMPKVYGDKLTHSNDPDNPIPPLVVIGAHGQAEGPG